MRPPERQVIGPKTVATWLRAASVPFEPVALAQSAAAAASAADGPGPWVVKAGGLVHKSDRGGVVTGQVDAAAVAAAATVLLERLGEDALPLMVQRERRGTEMLVGLRREPGVGAVVVVGLGGVHAEVLDDTVQLLVPSSPADIRAGLARLRGWPLLVGHRGGPALDVDGLVKLVVAVCGLAEQHPELLELDLNPVLVAEAGRGVVAVDARMLAVDAVPPIRRPAPDLRRALDPRHVVVVGVSDDATKIGSRIHENLRRHGFDGRLEAVNPGGGSSSGRPRLRGLSELDTAPDLVSVAVPAAHVLEVARDAVAVGAGALVVHGSGFAETGARGRELQGDLEAIAIDAGIPLFGPNSMGLVRPSRGLAVSLSGTLSRPDLPAGGISLVSTSGALSSSLASRLWERGGGIASWLALGNEAGVDVGAAVEWLVDDPETTTLGLLLERIVDGPRLLAALRAHAERGRPVFVYATARTESGRAAVRSHTGAMVGGHAVRRALTDAGGAVSLERLLDLEDALLQTERTPVPAGLRLGVITGSGGACAIIADTAMETGVELPPFPDAAAADIVTSLPPFAEVANPLDVTAQVFNHPADFGAVVDAAAGCGAFDALLVQFTTNADPAAAVTAEQVIAARARADVPIYVSRYGAPDIAPDGMQRYRDAGVPVMDAPDHALRVVAAIMRSGGRW